MAANLEVDRTMNIDTKKLQGKNIGNLRKSVNKLDTRLLSLLAERRSVSRALAQCKVKTNKKIRDIGYEQGLLSDLVEKGRTLDLDAVYVVQLFNTIIHDSVISQNIELENQLNPGKVKEVNRVSYLGEKGAYSHMAVHRYFARRPGTLVDMGCSSFKSVIEKVENDQADYGVLPIENSTSGSIDDVYDLLQQTNLSIVGEVIQPIEHSLLSPFPDVLVKELKTLYVHPQVYAQCSHFLASLDHVNVEYCDSTSTAMLKAANDQARKSAAMGGGAGCVSYGLHVVKSDLANQKENHTRFIIVSRTPMKVAPHVAAKSSLIISVGQKPGALVDALLVLKESSVALCKLESRPVEGNPFEEMFYLDMEANLETEEMQTVLEYLRRKTRYLKVLGCYPNEGFIHCEPDYAALNKKANDTARSGKKPVPAKAKKAKKSGHLFSRDYQAEDTIIQVGNVSVGGDSFITIAGPCSVESKSQIDVSAKQVKECGAQLLRGGCFKPRTNPYSFQGLGYEGLDLLEAAGKRYRLPIVTEVLSPEDVASVARQADILQIGTRNMQNFSLLKTMGKVCRPVILKRGMMATIDELLNAAEYILAGGNRDVILCERGIRTFETATRNTLDLSAVPVLKALTHLPIIVDPSHAVGRRDLIAPLAKAAKAVGAHGIMVEIHPKPEEALSDGPQALYFDQFAELMAELNG